MPRSPFRNARKLFQDRETGEARGSGKKIDFAFSWPFLGVLALFLIGVIAWAFFMGFMVGQGHNPQVKIRELTGLSLSDGEAGDSAPPQVLESKDQAEPVLPAQEKEGEKTQKSGADAAFRRPEGKGLAAWGEEALKPTAAPQAAKDKPAPPPTAQDLFDYTFQIAAFKSQADAENLQRKLTAVKVRTKIQKSGKVLLLIANLRGNAGAPEELRRKLLPLKLGKPLQLSKKPVAPRAKRSK